MSARCIILYDSRTVDLGQWLLRITQEKMAALFSEIVVEEVDDELHYYERARHLDHDSAASVARVATSHQDPVPAAAVPAPAPATGDARGASVTVVVVVFWDGMSEAAKTSFGEFKTWATSRRTSLVVQALNAKRGAHTLTENADALVSSISKKIAGPGAATTTGAANSATGGGGGGGTAAASGGAGGAAGDVLVREDRVDALSIETIMAKLRTGQGECFWVVSTSKDEFERAVAEVRSMAARLSCGMFPVTAQPRVLAAPTVGGSAPPTTSATPSSPTPPTGGPTNASVLVVAQEFMLRQHREMEHIELRLAMCGNVDSGKSTLTSVLTRGVRDDGRGLARAFVFNHKHEADTGRTSSVSENHLGFDAEGNVVNYDGKSVPSVARELLANSGGSAPLPTAAPAAAVAAGDGFQEGGSGKTSAAFAHHQHISAHDLAMRSDKVVTLYDLAGHEKYLKTTVLGMTRSMPDYACIVISANNGIQRMTKEHLGLCLALKLPFFVVVTRIDATPDNVRTETVQSIVKLLKTPTVKKLPFPVKKADDVIVAAKNLPFDRITPVFEISNVSGHGIADLLQFINLLPVRKDWASLVAAPKEMIIDSTFFVTGVGTVVGGIVTQGRFKPGDTVWLGPDGLGAFRTTQIKSIHVKGVEVEHVDAGNDAALCLKKEKRSAVRKGNVLLEVADPKVMPKAFWQFEAEIVILYHATTISVNYEPVIHSTTVRQSARILSVEQDVLRTGDRSHVRFHYLYRPEFMKVGQRMIFREGRTKGIGTVTKLVEEHDETFIRNAKLHAKETARATHAK